MKHTGWLSSSGNLLHLLLFVNAFCAIASLILLFDIHIRYFVMGVASVLVMSGLEHFCSTIITATVCSRVNALDIAAAHTQLLRKCIVCLIITGTIFIENEFTSHCLLITFVEIVINRGMLAVASTTGYYILEESAIALLAKFRLFAATLSTLICMCFLAY